MTYQRTTGLVVPGYGTNAKPLSDAIIQNGFPIDGFGAQSGFTHGEWTTAIQQAVDYAAANTGVLYIPPGQWMSNVIYLPSNLTVVGAGRQSILEQVSNSSGHFIQLANPATTYGVKLDNFTVDGNKSNQSNANNGVHFDNTGIGFSVPGSANHTITRLFITSTKGDGLYLGPEMRDSHVSFINVYNCDGYGVRLCGADSFVSHVDSGQSGLDGFFFDNGGSYTLTNCRSWYSGRIDNIGAGFNIAGQQNQLVGCYSQENYGPGFKVYRAGQQVEGLVLSGCVSDADNYIGTYSAVSLFRVKNGLVNVLVTKFTGGRGMPYRALDINGGCAGCVVDIASIATTSYAVAGTDMAANSIRIASRDTVKTESYVANYTVFPQSYGKIVFPSLTGNINIAVSAAPTANLTLAFSFTQDATGGRTVTFDANFKTNWTPDTAAGKTNIIEFLSDGTYWYQTSASTGL